MQNNNLPNIMTLDFTEPRRSRSGIYCFDRNFRAISTNEIGLSEGSVNLLTGMPGLGKTTLIMHLLDGMSKNNCLTVLATNEQTKNQVTAVAHRIQLNCINFVFDEQYQTRELIRMVSEIQKKFPGKQVIVAIDSLQGLNKDVRNSTARAWEDLEMFAKKTGVIILLINHLRKDKQMAGAAVLYQRCDAKMELSRDDGGDLSLYIEKNRHGPADVSINNIKMSPDGISFEKALVYESGRIIDTKKENTSFSGMMDSILKVVK